MDLGLGAAEENELDAWLRSVPPSCDRPWIAFGPGSKMPAKRWPLERFFEVGAALIEKRDIWPVVLGGPEEGEMGTELVRRWRRGYNAAGTLSLRGAAAALKRCQLYIGNDTGTMHLAAAIGIPCAAVFAARDQPGKWHPYGQGHRVFRATIECEGCGLAECLDRHNDCLKRVSVQEVVTASIELFHETRRTPPVPTTLTCSTAVS
jgi:ADP-heptose:LPS heptosyltransferase